MKPLVTVVIPFYNDPYVDQAIQSVLDQSYAPLEIIVVDDGSSQYTERLIPYYPYIHYLGTSNGGTASALNHGIKHASGKYVAWLSSDDLFYPDKIERQVQFMVQKNALISYTNFNYIDDQNRITQHHASLVFAHLLEFYYCFFRGNPVNGCTVMMRRDLFNRIGMFNTSLPYTHDLDFWYRVILSGIPFPYLDESLVGYRWHNAMGTVKHRTAIDKEFVQTQARMRDSLTRLILNMGGH
ncbi:glycosyltransferase [Paenibacillus sp. KQZ6P-2]|uniref:Glycosyltransferase n=1 Tax=Paenibacillus mangrovi TaxID=2931978 RepID=A0A9X1WUN0_9BACL|nr:glycosyltransferase [Paenibacillus mangrovi]MCJ8013888.1 glycosyltransferase [Paenibacillus mangrovi]